MPIYEYGCNACGCEFEELVFDDATPACPKCGSSDTKKLMSCCARRSKSGSDYAMPPSASSGGGCSGCSGGNCAACGH